MQCILTYFTSSNKKIPVLPLDGHKGCAFYTCSMCRYVTPGEMKTEYPIIIGGNNFGCGSSREHAPVALGAAGARVVIAQSYARIFFRNCVATYAFSRCSQLLYKGCTTMAPRSAV